jgi:uncharacterized protein
VKYAVFYDSADDVAAKAPAHFPAHQAWYQEFHRRGELLMIGPFADRQGGMSVFTTREAAEEFVRGDPFVINGVVSGWSIREWNEAVVPDGAAG